MHIQFLDDDRVKHLDFFHVVFFLDSPFKGGTSLMPRYVVWFIL